MAKPRQAGAEAVVTPCQTCYLGLVNGVEETASSMRVYHLNEMLVRSVCPDVKHEEVKAAFESLASRAPAPKTLP
jgi:heterodisulfide reductase subunit B